MKHESQTDGNKGGVTHLLLIIVLHFLCILQFLNLTEGFGGKFGVQSDRVDKVQYFFYYCLLAQANIIWRLYNERTIY